MDDAVALLVDERVEARPRVEAGVAPSDALAARAIAR
jgi:hypothetical protein